MSRLQAEGVGLFLFIPVVLFLFVRHPAPILGSLAAGVVLMLGHRVVARPYMRRAKDAKCLWCNRGLREGEGEPLLLAVPDGVLEARACGGHVPAAWRYLGFLDRARWPLRIGIFLPLLVLLGALLAVGSGGEAPLDDATAFFQLAVGITVNVAAFGYLAVAPPTTPPAVPFPVHNFFLLGIRTLLWIFRIVGIWWIVVGLRHFLGPG